MHIRKNDTVVLLKSITGKPDREKGYRGRVLIVERERGKVIVEGVAFRYKHVRPSQQHQHGGRITKEMPIDISNVLLLCPKCDRGVKTIKKVDEEGKAHRVCRKCSEEIEIPSS